MIASMMIAFSEHGSGMFIQSTLSISLILACAFYCVAQDEPVSKPIELDVLKSSVGVWNAEIEVWPSGPESTSIKFTGVETNRPYGEHWISSDFDSEYMGQTMRVHTIVGYDLEQQKLVGMTIDDGPYAASMIGDYNQETKTIHWETKAKDTNGNPMLQKTSVTQQEPDKRILTLFVSGKKPDDFTKFMQIKFVRRK